ncbi:SIR2 family protein [Rhodococcus pyridinivorans]|uniref:SIR2 family protein n=1 Tax=Rhodococcus pyridinivorans TaxID=103816 RepID=UPI001E520CC7|nr:SIR2 family protein [Rhodococcus pyridinivorans]MCD5422665.1 SIR2 family protein [Rhodococcus pyridinivorans]
MTNLPDPAIAEALLPLAFSLHDDPGTYALIAGAGISYGAVPVAWEVFTDLIIRAAHTQSVELDRDTAADWYRKRFGTEPTYEGVLEQLGTTQTARQAILRQVFEPDGRLPEPTNAHRAVARLMRAGVIRIVVTMNFDRLFEQALRDEGVEPKIVATEAAAAALGPLHSVRACIIHLHGECQDPESMRNTIDELSAYPERMQALIEQIAREYGLVIAGWSAEYDPVLRGTIETHYPRRYRAVWIDPSDPKPMAAKALTLLQGTPIHTTADEAFAHLADAVDALATRRARNPLTLPVAIDTAKRELSGQHTAISLHDRLHAEFQRLHGLDDLSRTDGTDTEYTELVARLEEASAVAAGLVAVLAYWGTPDTDGWWIDEVARFARVSPATSHHPQFWKARRLIGTRLLYAAGISAVAARRYATFGALTQLTTPSYTTKGNHDSVLEVCGADTAYEQVPRGARRQYKQLQPILDRALGLTHDALDDAWQRFEILRLTTLVLAHPDFETRRDTYLEYKKTHENLTEQDPARQQAWQDRHRSLADTARWLPVDRLHILMHDTNAGDPRITNWSSTAITQLARDLDTNDEHPLVSIGAVHDDGDLRIALDAVNSQLEIQTHKHTRPDTPGTRAEPDAVWLDIPVSDR